MGSDGRRAVTLALALLFAAPSLGEGESLNAAYLRVSTSVVVIRAQGQEVTEGGTVRFKEIGSGVLISPDGKVATAAHVVQTMQNITVEFLGEEPVAARVIASEQWADISILQVSLVPRGATVSKLADSDPARVGDPVFIVGAPYGLSYSLSAGIISARWAADTIAKDFPLAEFFQTDAVINTGNSGGPMFSEAGELIGIVSHNITKSGGSEGLGFVVTSNTVNSLLVERGVKDSVGGRLGLKGGDRTVIVEGQQIVVGGDILLSVQGIPFASVEDRAKVLKALDTLKPGDDLRVAVFRDDKVVELAMKF